MVFFLGWGQVLGLPVLICVQVLWLTCWHAMEDLWPIYYKVCVCVWGSKTLQTTVLQHEVVFNNHSVILKEHYLLSDYLSLSAFKLLKIVFRNRSNVIASIWALTVGPLGFSPAVTPYLGFITGSGSGVNPTPGLGLAGLKERLLMAV